LIINTSVGYSFVIASGGAATEGRPYS
jgi:hypothetical protein